MSLLVWIGVALLGGAGAALRFLVDGAVTRRVRSGFPFGTLIVNVTGAGALGLVAGTALRDDAALLAGTAVIGSYTTFSTWLFETHRLGEESRTPLSAANLVLSVAAGVAAVVVGQQLGARL